MSKDRLIQVQKPAQSLERFQQDYSRTQAGGDSLLRPILMGVGTVAILGLGYLIFDQWRASRLEKFEGSLAALVEEVEGGATPATGEALQKKMREALPRLEALAQGAPGSRRAMAQGMVASWKLAVEGQGAAPGGEDAWSRLAKVRRALALGQATEAAQILEGLRKQAGPSEAWASAFWQVQFEVDRLGGAAGAAKAHLADYRARFQGKAADPAILSAAEAI